MLDFSKFINIHRTIHVQNFCCNSVAKRRKTSQRRDQYNNNKKQIKYAGEPEGRDQMEALEVEALANSTAPWKPFTILHQRGIAAAAAEHVRACEVCVCRPLL
jgi:hypothetical protein